MSGGTGTGVIVTTEMADHVRTSCQRITLNIVQMMLSGIVLLGFDGASIMEDHSRGENCYTAFPVFNGGGPTLRQTMDYIREVRKRFDQTSYLKAEVEPFDNTFEDESPRYVVRIKIL
jgi:hypothetical protein